jgi:nucleoid DNA-binding protein
MAARTASFASLARVQEERPTLSMTKRDLVVRIANETGLVQQDVFMVIQQTLDRIIESLEMGKNVEFRNFGVFEVRTRKQRIGRNPIKPEQIVTIPERKVVKFKPGKIMREVITREEE